MSTSRQLHLNAFLHDVGHHEASWRLPGTDPLLATDVDHYVSGARLAESGTFDSIFFADGMSLMGDPRFRPAGVLEPTTLLGALAVSTSRIGLIATASTTYLEPYDLARRFASLDHISHGRVGWNIVTSAGDEPARNFGRDTQTLHRDRYERADEFMEVVTKLWDSWEDDARIADKAAGRFGDAARIRAIEHVGQQFSVAGALNVPRSPQGYPVLVQAGSSSDGREFAGRWGEAIFTAQRTLAEGQTFSADIRRRAQAQGRSADSVLVLPGIAPIIGSTVDEARRLERELDELIVPDHGLGLLSTFFGTDLTGIELDEPLPDLPTAELNEGHRSRAQLISDMAARDALTVRQLLVRLGGGRGHRTFVGTPDQLADDLEEWFTQGAADGFNVMAPAIPRDLQAFVDHVVPLLRARGLFRTDYEGTTLREHYGLARPANRLATH